MTEEQFTALVALMRAIAYDEAGDAVRQPRPQHIVREAEHDARVAFNLVH